MTQADLQSYREEFADGEIVLVQMRQYGGVAALREARIEDADRTFVTVRFCHNSQVRKMPYSRIMKRTPEAELPPKPEPKAKVVQMKKAEPEPKADAAPTLRSVPPAFQTLPALVPPPPPPPAPEEDAKPEATQATSEAAAAQADVSFVRSKDSSDELSLFSDMMLEDMLKKQAQLNAEAEQMDRDAARLADEAEAKRRQADKLSVRIKKFQTLAARLMQELGDDDEEDLAAI